MLKKTFLLGILFFLINTAFSQNYNWITPNQTYLKLYISDDGIYRINKIDFTNAGINTGSIDPRTVKVYYNGNQIPAYFFGEQDGVFDDSDYLDFYGTRNYGGLTNYYDSYNQVSYTKDEYLNIYSDTSAYWIGWGGSNGLRYSDYGYTSSSTYPLDYYYSKYHFEKDLVYSLGESWSSSDYRNFSNDLFLGEGWYWRIMNFNNTQTDTFSTPLKTLNTQNCLLKIFAYPINRSTSVYNEHRIILKINNNTFPDTLVSDDFNRFDTTIIFPSSYLNQSGVNNYSIRYFPSAFTTGQIYLDFLEILYPHSFSFDNNSVRFTSTLPDTNTVTFKIKGYNISNPVDIYDIKNNYRIINNQVSNDTLIFSGKANGQYEIYNKVITKKPFRIKQRQVPDLVSSSNGVDYLIIYNKLFESQAEQLRQHRANHNSFRSVKTEIEDIYDIFNYGMENPVAIRNYTKYIYNNWQAPKIKFLCLFGRGSLDPKKNMASSQYWQNFVPVYGNPPADGYFGNVNDGSFTYYWHFSIGRIPVISTQEAQFAVNKIIAYDNEPINTWVKEPIFITSGTDRSSEIEFMSKSEYFINSFITPRPISSLPVKIYKNDSAGYATFNLRDSTKNSINRGGLLVNYIGHSGDTKWENVLDDPSILTNGSKLPLIFSMTCFTGRNATADLRSFGESFFFNANGGAIGFVGTTGWSFSGSGNDFNGYLIQSLAQDSVRYFGDIVKYANNVMKADSLSFPVRNTINCYNFIGDPASKLILPTHPEFDINLSDYNISTPYPVVGENITLNVNPKNLGIFADSCKIRFRLNKFNQFYRQKDTVMYNFAYRNSVNINFKIDTTGLFEASIVLDPDNWYPLDIKTNNSISFPIVLKNSSFIPLKPIDNSLIRYDSLIFVGLNPQINLVNNNVKVILELDTTNSFNSPLKRTFFKTNLSGVISKFYSPVPILDTNILYFWRSLVIINNDSSGWSEIKKFYYKPGIKNNTRDISSNTNRDNSKYSPSVPDYDTIVTINKKSFKQFQDNISNISLDSGNMKLSGFTGNLFVRSLGTNAFEASYFIANNYMFLMDGGTNPGLNMLKVRKIDGKVLAFKNVWMSTTVSSDTALNFLNTFDSTQYLLTLNASLGITTYPFNAATKQKYRDFGSIYADSLPVLGWFHTWSFIGFLGAQHSQVSEQYHPYSPLLGWVESISQMSPQFSYTSGSLVSNIGPAQHWKNFQWDQVIYPNSSIAFDVYGVDRNNQTVLLYTNLTNNNLVSLDTLNAYQFPNLKLVTKLNIDTLSGTQSPLFKSLTLRYQPPAELVIDSIRLITPEPIISYGDEVRVKANYYNVGYTNAYGVIGNWYVYVNTGEKVVLKSDTLRSVLKIDSMSSSSALLTINYFPPNVRKFYGFVTLYFEVKGLGQQNDYYDYNNTAFVNIQIKNGPTMSKRIEVFADGVKLQGGEYVKQKPEIVIKSSGDENINFIETDSSAFKVFVNNNYVALQSNLDRLANKNSKGIDKKVSKQNQSSLTFYPDLKNGENILKFIMKTSDGNSFDTVNYSVLVSNELLLKELTNYPNPMKGETNFLFTLTGATNPAGCKIKIYTVSGRLVKTINSSVNIGSNQISWDGRDNEGDYMANGVYFYQLIIEGDTNKESSIQKLVILK
jgi:hypothetical protein